MEQIIKITARSNFEKEEYGFNPRLAVGVGDPESAKKKADEDEIERKNKMRQVCLNCTKEKCNGGRTCFLKEKQKYD